MQRGITRHGDVQTLLDAMQPEIQQFSYQEYVEPSPLANDCVACITVVLACPKLHWNFQKPRLGVARERQAKHHGAQLKASTGTIYFTTTSASLCDRTISSLTLEAMSDVAASQPPNPTWI